MSVTECEKSVTNISNLSPTQTVFLIYYHHRYYRFYWILIMSRLMTSNRLKFFGIIDKYGSICTFLYVQKITIWIVQWTLECWIVISSNCYNEVRLHDGRCPYTTLYDTLKWPRRRTPSRGPLYLNIPNFTVQIHTVIIFCTRSYKIVPIEPIAWLRRFFSAEFQDSQNYLENSKKFVN